MAHTAHTHTHTKKGNKRTKTKKSLHRKTEKSQIKTQRQQNMTSILFVATSLSRYTEPKILWCGFSWKNELVTAMNKTGINDLILYV